MMVMTRHLIAKQLQRTTCQWRTARLSSTLPTDCQPHAAATAVRRWAGQQVYIYNVGGIIVGQRPDNKYATSTLHCLWI